MLKAGLKQIPFLLFALFFSLLGHMSAQAVQPDEMLSDPVLEERARVISKDLRCLVCQNQNIDDSDADLAKDLRILVRERLVAGDSNDAAIAFITDRYGNYVLLNPPMNIQTTLLWLGPLVIFLLGGSAVFFWFHGQRKLLPLQEASTGKAAKLNADEEARLRELLGEGLDQDPAVEDKDGNETKS